MYGNTLRIFFICCQGGFKPQATLGYATGGAPGPPILAGTGRGIYTKRLGNFVGEGLGSMVE